ncbi:MAG: VWA domain-containing protein [Verrucomicrobia bacterium]|nr:VWA domain-containing protein [Verrucomicrobiota bacterium]
MSPIFSATQPVPDNVTTGGRLVDADGRQIPLRGCSIDVDARGGLARVVLLQTFLNDSSEPLQATYQFPLPAEAAVGGYSFTMKGRRVVGEIDRLESARKRFEDAVLEGRTAGLVEQDRSSVFTQEIGNIPPHSEVTCELEIDQKLRWLGDGQWEWRFPTTIAPRYMGQPGRVSDRDRLTVDVTTGTPEARVCLNLRVRDERLTSAPSSPTHRVRLGSNGAVVFEVDGGEPPDRDVVVRWAVAAPQVGLTIDTARLPADQPSSSTAFGLVTLVPPTSTESLAALPRDLILLLDTSGSMEGRPLETAKAMALAVIASMGPADRLEMIEFSNEPRRWQSEPRSCDERTRVEASKWIRALAAGGGTEMHSGLMKALVGLRPDAQRQVILLTDGLVGFDAEIVGAVRRQTPSGCRVHTVGIGSASNRSLTHAVAVAGGGGEFLVDLDDDTAEAAARLVARLSKPLVVDVRVSGSALLESGGTMPIDLMAGAPAVIPVKLRPEGGLIVVEGRTPQGTWSTRATLEPIPVGTGSGSLVRVFGRECVERLELDAAAGQNVDHRIESLGLEYRIATRLTSWVAVSEEATVDPTKPIHRVRIAQQIPYGMSAEGLGLHQHLAGASLGVCASPALGMRFARAMPEYSAADVAFDMSEGIGQFEETDLDSRSRRHDEFLYARITSRQGERLVLEIHSDHTIEWDPASVVTNFTSSMRIDRSATTRPGRYDPRYGVRIVLLDIPTSVTTESIRLVWVRSSLGDILELRVVP